MNQRLGKRHLPPLGDVVTDLGKDNNLLQLVEILSEQQCKAKLHASPRFKAQILENVAHGLQFCWDCGVTMALKPSRENLYDGDEPAVLGLIWALVRDTQFLMILLFGQRSREGIPVVACMP